MKRKKDIYVVDIKLFQYYNRTKKIVWKVKKRRWKIINMKRKKYFVSGNVIREWIIWRQFNKAYKWMKKKKKFIFKLFDDAFKKVDERERVREFLFNIRNILLNKTIYIHIYMNILPLALHPLSSLLHMNNNYYLKSALYFIMTHLH